MARLVHVGLYHILVLALYTNFVNPLYQVSAVTAPAPAPAGPVPAPGPKAPVPAPGPKAPVPAPSVTPSPADTPPQDITPPPPPTPPKKKVSKGLSGGQKAGVVFGVLIGAGLLGFGAFVYKKRSDNIRRGRYGIAARTTML